MKRKAKNVRALICITLALANVMAAPRLFAALNSTPNSELPGLLDNRAQVPCCSRVDPPKNSWDSAIQFQELFAQAGGGGHLIPNCPENCTTDVLGWNFCQEVPFDCDPEDASLDDQKWHHKFTAYFCQGQNYFNCDGYTWKVVGCCADAKSGTLPVGCVPIENDPDWKYCQHTE